MVVKVEIKRIFEIIYLQLNGMMNLHYTDIIHLKWYYVLRAMTMNNNGQSEINTIRLLFYLNINIFCITDILKNRLITYKYI